MTTTKMTCRSLGAAAMFVIGCVGALPAQDRRLDRIPEGARAAVALLLDSASVARLPTGALMSRALEGTTKGADASSIIRAVQRLFTQLRQAQEALGGSATASEIAGGADALRAGITPARLREMASAVGEHRDLTVSLALATDLAIRGVPPDSAARLVVGAAQSNPDAALLALGREVDRDIAVGTPPLPAAAGRLLDASSSNKTNQSGGGALSGGGGAPQPPPARKP